MGPYRPDQVSTGAQPDWYMGFSEGLIRVMPGWEINFWGHTLVLGVFIPLVIFPLVLVAIAVYPFIESWVTGDKREHHILDRPRNAPTRTAFGVAWITWYMVLLIGGGNDLWATHFHLSINSITWFVRIAFFVAPVVAFIVTKRICLGLQRRDKDKVLHGRESGIIKRLPHGEFIEVHEPLSQEQLHTLTAHEQYEPAEIGADGRRERCRAQGQGRRRSCAPSSARATTARTARSPSPPPRSTRRSRAATATTDRSASPRHGRRAPSDASDGALRRAPGWIGWTRRRLRGPRGSPCRGHDDPGAAYERCDPRWRRHRGGPFLARAC